MHTLRKVREVVIITAQFRAMLDGFCRYGGWTHLFTRKMPPAVLRDWGLPAHATAREALIQFIDVDYGRIRFVEIKGVPQQPMRPASKLWDTGGVLDVDLRVHDLDEAFNALTDRGWSGAAVPMPLPVDDFVLDECLMTNADSVMLALAKRHHPPLTLPEGRKLASHVYLSAMTVRDLAVSTDFFVEKLGFSLVNDRLTVRYPPDSPNNFGVPHNFSDAFEIVLSIYSPDGTRDSMVECIQTVGLRGHDHAARCHPPNRGIVGYRVEVQGLDAYRQTLESRDVPLASAPNRQVWPGIGPVRTFTVRSPDGAWVMFFEEE